METQTRESAVIYQAIRTLEGEGFEVRRALPTANVSAVGPFILLDHIGPFSAPPGQAKGTGFHPHAGMETITYLLEGQNRHQDNLGNDEEVEAYEAQWMRAGGGIIHKEGPSAEMFRTGGSIHGVQLWLNMPEKTKHDAPVYQSVTRDEIPQITLAEGVAARVLIGDFAGETGPIETGGEPILAHIASDGAQTITLPKFDREAAVYIMSGGAVIKGKKDHPISEGRWIHLPAAFPSLSLELAPNTDLIVFGGAPIDAPIVRHGPFVMSTEQEMRDVITAYQNGQGGFAPVM
ncbi:MAG: pirin family protein [Pseudomonadota bacterium]